jgi:hypothetical protein
MKKLFVVCVVAFVFIVSLGVAHAVNKDNTGCGLGYLIFKDSGDSTAIESIAVTTNGTFGNQTFGITTGTLECSQPASFVSNERLNEFVASNMDTIARDIAAGDGEALATLAELMEVPSVERDEFFSTLQKNFSEIFTSEDIQSAQVIDNIVNVITKS